MDVKYPTVAFHVDLTILNDVKQLLPSLTACGRGDVWENSGTPTTPFP